ncbi:MAG: winged helix-turn-helix transcriptional regulator [Candidatus Diapherotrites archaeon]|nr:winged helix-turn-helix transcriptional regulator [Candidatus Diapherotrites archaeon]
MRVPLFLALVLFMSAANAVVFLEYAVSIHINQDLSAEQNIRLNIMNNDTRPIKELNISLPYGTVKEVKHARYSNNALVLDEPLLQHKNVTVDVLLTSEQVVGEIRGRKALFLMTHIPYATEHFSLDVSLPVGYVVANEKEETYPVYPTPEYSSDGRHIILRWRDTNLSPNQYIETFIIFESVIRKERTIIGIPTKDIKWAIPGIILSFLFGYFLAAGALSALMQKIRQIPVQLNEDEKNIVDILSKHKHITQAELLRKTNFSKAKLSRLLRSMEERNIIKKETKGKTNIISLK